METVDGAHDDAAGALALVAAFGDEMGYRKSSWPAAQAPWSIFGHPRDGGRPTQEMKL